MHSARLQCELVQKPGPGGCPELHFADRSEVVSHPVTEMEEKGANSRDISGRGAALY